MSEEKLHRRTFLVLTRDKEERIIGLEDAARVYNEWVEEYGYARLYREDYYSEEEYEERKPARLTLMERYDG